MITFILYKEDETIETTTGEQYVVPVQTTADSENLTETVVAPMTGQIIALEEVEDPTFAQAILGQGIAIKPTDGLVKSPIKGEIVTIFETKHAIGLKTDSGLELLIHIGIDTVQLKGEHFTQLANNGQRVEIGTPLVQVDLAAIEAAGYDTITPIVVTNTMDYAGVLPTGEGLVNTGDEVIKVIK